MPNWCKNRLLISSENTNQLREFINIVRDRENKTDLSFAKLLPCPQELMETGLRDKAPRDERDKLKKKYGHPDWYDWCITNWGTEWDVKAKLVIDSNHFATYEFESVMSPPAKWVNNIALLYPDLDFKLTCTEAGLSIQGVFIAHSVETFEYYK